MSLLSVQLDDKYRKDSGRVYISAIQALARLPLAQRKSDLAAGLNTAGYISGYRGSPLAAVDKALWQIKPLLSEHHVHFQPGLNEDLAATAVWGSQQTNMYQDAKYDGVFAMWYAKGPGVDRSGDVFRHANFAGTSRHGGVLAAFGDDPACVSSTIPQQSEFSLISAMIPILYPAGVAELYEMGLAGWAMSRFSGCWSGLKVLTDTAESSAVIDIDPGRPHLVFPEVDMPPDGVWIRWPDPPERQEERLLRYKLPLVQAFARANTLDRVILRGARPRLGIVTAGKTYLDVRQALEDLGLDEAKAADLGISLYKIGLTWPLVSDSLVDFAQGLEELLIIEEGRPFLEPQIKDVLYGLADGKRPRITGKQDEKGQVQLPSHGELTAVEVARLIAARIAGFHMDETIRRHLDLLEKKEAAQKTPHVTFERTPYFCSGCPHNTSTKVPEGSRALAGIGCHVMAMWMDRETDTWVQMGGEGVPWLGQAPFTNTSHIFANLGDGTYFHSGILAIRAAIAAGVNITYKLLYNDAVAMTGGQPVDGQMTVQQMAHQLAAEGVKHLAVVSDDTDKYSDLPPLPTGTSLHDREEMDFLQRQMRERKGVSVIIYEQTCATEKRRRRKRGRLEDPAKWAFINQRVCEGCGDCGVQSNCLSVTPVETDFGRKRMIDQSTCNKDYSCLKGFCPSFVTIHGGSLARRPGTQVDDTIFAALPDPVLPDTATPKKLLISGVGGTGVVTVSAILGMATHIEGKGSLVLDVTGLAQKYGAVYAHIQIADRQDDLFAPRIATGGADTLLGTDLVASASDLILSKLRPGSRAIINSRLSVTGAFTRDPDLQVPGAELARQIVNSMGEENVLFTDASALATALMGDSIGSNLFLLGYAHQQGLIPLSAGAIEAAIDLNGIAVEANKRVFRWGRLAAHDWEKLASVLGETMSPSAAPAPALTAPKRGDAATGLDELVARRAADLTAYQNTAYGRRYEALVHRVMTAEAEKTPGKYGLAEAVARFYYKLLAYKDEYEVARLFTDPAFKSALSSQFTGFRQIRFHMAPPILAKKDPVTGLPRKREFGPWMLPLLKGLARLKFLRGTPIDPFGGTEERRQERALIRDYETMIETLIHHLDHDRHDLAVQIAEIPEGIRGFGHVKERHITEAKKREAALLALYRQPTRRDTAAE